MASRVVKGGPALTEYLNASKSAEPLFGDVQKHVLAKAQQPSGRRQDVLHPSEIVKSDWCHRSAFHRLRLGAEPPDRLKTTFTRENIFAEGHQTHTKWQTWLTEMGRLAGDWRCAHCGVVFWHETTPTCCHGCSAPATCLTYAEVPLSADPLRIGGKADGYSPRDWALVEIKTLGLGSLRFERPEFLNRFMVGTEEFGPLPDLTRLWRQFRRPLPAAIRQTQLYMYLANHFEDLPTEKTVFIYDFKPTQESKSFTVTYDERFSEPVIEAAATIVDCIETDSAPPCNINGRAGCASCLAFEESK
ncbi:hypothetical protein ACF06W_11680 [Streptomyces albus]|uniref:hypothetical protein n=1 Tax=Streptomyces albus TaxID=1888 RepID=UPI0036FB4CD0